MTASPLSEAGVLPARSLARIREALAVCVLARKEQHGGQWREFSEDHGYISPVTQKATTNLLWRVAFPFACRPDGSMYTHGLPRGDRLPTIMERLRITFTLEGDGDLAEILAAIDHQPWPESDRKTAAAIMRAFESR